MVKLEVGKFYKTRNGEKVGPMAENTFGTFIPLYKFRDAETGLTYLEDGTYEIDLIRDEDLIAEWQDAPAEVIGENVRAVMINAAPDELFDRMAETRCKPYDAPRSKYHRIIKGVEVDIYDILVAWGVTCPARQHAIKKLFMTGERGAKGVVQDLDEAIQATERAKELV